MLLVAAAFAMDPTHATFQRALDGRVSNGRVDYAALKKDPRALDAYLAELAAADLSRMSAAEKKAFLVNAYNAITLDVVADAWPIRSIKDLDGGKVWSTRRFRVAGADRTLDEIEHVLLRPLGDARIHAAINCASVGCPPLSPKAYAVATLDAQLDAAARSLAASATIAGGTLTVSTIHDWFGDDFVPTYGRSRWDIPGLDGKEEAAANFVAAYAPDKAAALRAGGYRVAYAPWDWSVNGR